MIKRNRSLIRGVEPLMRLYGKYNHKSHSDLRHRLDACCDSLMVTTTAKPFAKSAIGFFDS